MTQKYALITGSSGLLGTLMNDSLRATGVKTIGLIHKSKVPTDYGIHSVAEVSQYTQHLDLVLNLAGSPIAGAPWTRHQKNKLLRSRIDVTKRLIHSMREHQLTTEHFISGSAIGYYGTGSDFKNEESPQGNDFSAQLCQQWELESMKAANVANRVTQVRTGLVLAPKGGYLAPLALTTKLGAGAYFGSAEQGQSWIDYRDWTNAICHIIKTETVGKVNLTAPNPVSQRKLMNTLGRVLKRPIFLKIPAFALYPLGEMKTLFLDGQYVLPTKLQTGHFEFQYPTIEESLANMWP